MKDPHGMKKKLFIYVEKVKVHRVLSSHLELLVAAKKEEEFMLILRE